MDACPRAISVVIPARNDADKLDACLDALQRQTRPPDEVIVVDNASTDATGEVARRRRARCLTEPRLGIAPAASTGYDAATGDLIARLDADSVPDPDWLERVEAAYAADPALDVLTGPGHFPSLPRALAAIADVLYMRSYFVVFGRMLGRPPVFGSNFAMTRATWEEVRSRVHREDGEVHDDLDLSMVLPDGCRVVLDDSLRMPVSARPFASPAGILRRIRRGMHTMWVNRRDT